MGARGGGGWTQPPHLTAALPASPPPKEENERTTGKAALWLLEAPVRKIILQMHTPARTSRCWSRRRLASRGDGGAAGGVSALFNRNQQSCAIMASPRHTVCHTPTSIRSPPNAVPSWSEKWLKRPKTINPSGSEMRATPGFTSFFSGGVEVVPHVFPTGSTTVGTRPQDGCSPNKQQLSNRHELCKWKCSKRAHGLHPS